MAELLVKYRPDRGTKSLIMLRKLTGNPAQDPGTAAGGSPCLPNAVRPRYALRATRVDGFFLFRTSPTPVSPSVPLQRDVSRGGTAYRRRLNRVTPSDLQTSVAALSFASMTLRPAAAMSLDKLAAANSTSGSWRRMYAGCRAATSVAGVFRLEEMPRS